MSKLKYKLIFALVVTSFISLSILSCYSVFTIIRKNDADLKEYRAVLFDQFDRTMKLQVETAHSLVQNMYNQQQKGLLSEADTKKQAADLLRELRFDNGNYFWVYSNDGIAVVMLGRKDIEGVNRMEIVDTKGTKMIKDIINSGKQAQGGYTDYWFPKPNQTESLPKRSYNLAFKPYNWVIGSGNWVDDIDKLVAALLKWQ